MKDCLPSDSTKMLQAGEAQQPLNKKRKLYEALCRVGFLIGRDAGLEPTQPLGLLPVALPT